MFKAALVIFLLLATSPALACSCMLPPGSQSDHVRREFKTADAVFSAYVSDIHYVDLNGQRMRMAKLRILQVWKGNLQPEAWLDVVLGDEGGLIGCNYIAEQDQALIVYAHGQRQPYGLASCSLTGPLHQATGDIPLLNKLSDRGGQP